MESTENNSHDCGGKEFCERGVDVDAQNISTADFEQRREIVAKSIEINNPKKSGVIGRLRRFSSGANLDKASSDENVAKSRQFFSTDDLSRRQKRTKKKRPVSGNNMKDDVFYSEVLKSVNKYRKIHDAKPLKIHHRMSTYAKDYAKKLAKGQTANSRLGKKYGVTMFQKKLLSPTENVSGSEVVSEWYSEMSDFIFAESTEDLIMKGSNFSQLVWKNSSEIGIGIARSENKMAIYVVGLFRPQGNNKGHYSKQVSPARHHMKHESSSSSDDDSEDVATRKMSAGGTKKEKKPGKLSQFFSRLFKSSKSRRKAINKQGKNTTLSRNATTARITDTSSSNTSGDTKSTLKLQDLVQDRGTTSKGSYIVEQQKEQRNNDISDANVPTSLLKYISVDESIKYSDIVYPLEQENKAKNDDKLAAHSINTIDSPSNFLQKTDSYFGIEHSVSIQVGQILPEEEKVFRSDRRESQSSSSSSQSSKSSISKQEYQLLEENTIKLENKLAEKSNNFSNSIVSSKSSPIADSRKKTKNAFEQEQIALSNIEILKNEIAEACEDDSVFLEKVTPLNANNLGYYEDNKQKYLTKYSAAKIKSKERLSSNSSLSSDTSEKSVEFKLKNGTCEVSIGKELSDKETVIVKEVYENLSVGDREVEHYTMISIANTQESSTVDILGDVRLKEIAIGTELPDLEVKDSNITREITEVRKEVICEVVDILPASPLVKPVTNPTNNWEKKSISGDCSHKVVKKKFSSETRSRSRSSSSSSEGSAKVDITSLPNARSTPFDSTSSSSENEQKFKVTNVIKGDKPMDRKSRSSSSSSSSSSENDIRENVKLQSYVDIKQEEEKSIYKLNYIPGNAVLPIGLPIKDIDSASDSSEERTRVLVEKYFPLPEKAKSRTSSTSSSDVEENIIDITVAKCGASLRKQSSSDAEEHSLEHIPIDITSKKKLSSSTYSSPSSSDSERKHEDRVPEKMKDIVKRSKHYINSKKTTHLFDLETFPTNILREINHYRLLHAVPALNLDYYLCCLARKRAAQMVLPEDKQKTLYNYGELSHQTDDMTVTESSIVSSWYQTGESYRFGDVPEESHWPFTQIIWNDTVEFGAGGIYVAEEKKYILVTLFNPEGNVPGEYKTQINPPKNM